MQCNACRTVTSCFMFQSWSCAPPVNLPQTLPQLCFRFVFCFLNSLFEFKVLSEKKKKRFCVGTKPSFAFMHFEFQPLNRSHKLFASLSFPPLLYFSFLKIIDPAIYQRIETGDPEGLSAHAQWRVFLTLPVALTYRG